VVDFLLLAFATPPPNWRRPAKRKAYVARARVSYNVGFPFACSSKISHTRGSRWCRTKSMPRPSKLTRNGRKGGAAPHPGGRGGSRGKFGGVSPSSPLLAEAEPGTARKRSPPSNYTDTSTLPLYAHTNDDHVRKRTKRLSSDKPPPKLYTQDQVQCKELARIDTHHVLKLVRTGG